MRKGRKVQGVVLDIADDPYDRDVGTEEHTHAFADRIFCGKELADGCLAHDRHGSRLWRVKPVRVRLLWKPSDDGDRLPRVAIVEEAAAPKVNPQRVEVVGRCDAKRRVQLLPRCGRGPSLNVERHPVVRATERQMRDRAGGFDPRETFNARNEPIEERTAPVCLGVSRAWKVDRHDEHAARVEAWIHRHQAQEAVDQQSRAHEQDQRQCDFRSDQHRPKPLPSTVVRHPVAFAEPARMDARRAHRRNNAGGQSGAE